jgi:hypothetical protein
VGSSSGTSSKLGSVQKWVAHPALSSSSSSLAARLRGFGHGHELASAFVEDDAVTVAIHGVSSLEMMVSCSVDF